MHLKVSVNSNHVQWCTYEVDRKLRFRLTVVLSVFAVEASALYIGSDLELP